MTRVDRQLRPDVQLQQRDQREVSEVSRHQPRVQQVRVPASPELAANPAEPDLPLPGAQPGPGHQTRKGQSLIL